jgi:hypothetical protein
MALNTVFSVTCELTLQTRCLTVEYLHEKFEARSAILQLYLTKHDKGEQTSSQLLANLTRQLIEQSKHVSPELLSWYNRHLDTATRPLANEYMNIIMDVSTGFERIYIVIDGLDECTEQIRFDLLRTVNEVMHKTSCWLLVSSRRIDAVGVGLKNPLVLNVQARPEDVELYLWRCVWQMASLQGSVARHTDIMAKIIEAIIAKASGM